MKNPFELVYDALYNVVASDARIRALVRTGNLKSYGQLANVNPQNDVVNPADLPLMDLVAIGATTNLFDTSSTSRVIKRYSWGMYTGDYRIHNLHAVEWSLLCSMLRWKSILGGLRWPEGSDKSFVKSVKTGDLNTLLGGQQQDGKIIGIRGWTSIIAIEVDMHFTTATMLEIG